MTEIKKFTKIALVPIAIIPFIFGIINLFLFDAIFGAMTGLTNPMHPRFVGGLFILGAIFAVIIIRKKEWEEIRLVYMYLYLQFVPAILVEIFVWIVYGSTLNPLVITEFIFEQIIMWAMLLLGVFAYIRQVR